VVGVTQRDPAEGIQGLAQRRLGTWLSGLLLEVGSAGHCPDGVVESAAWCADLLEVGEGRGLRLLVSRLFGGLVGLVVAARCGGRRRAGAGAAPGGRP